jgi:hypothetical protein
MGNSETTAAGGLNNLKVNQFSKKDQGADYREQKFHFQVIGRGAISDKENPRRPYGIRRIVELQILDRGSSTTKPSHAVANPRISERSTVV